jgi:hypothetical protein
MAKKLGSQNSNLTPGRLSGFLYTQFQLPGWPLHGADHWGWGEVSMWVGDLP